MVHCRENRDISQITPSAWGSIPAVPAIHSTLPMAYSIVVSVSPSHSSVSIVLDTDTTPISPSTSGYPRRPALGRYVYLPWHSTPSESRGSLVSCTRKTYFRPFFPWKLELYLEIDRCVSPVVSMTLLTGHEPLVIKYRFVLTQPLVGRRFKASSHCQLNYLVKSLSLASRIFFWMLYSRRRALKYFLRRRLANILYAGVRGKYNRFQGQDIIVEHNEYKGLRIQAT